MTQRDYFLYSLTVFQKSIDFGQMAIVTRGGFVTRAEFFKRLAIGEGRVCNRIPPETNYRNPDIDFGLYESEESRRAWAHATDLGIFFGKTEDHHINPVIFAMRETRSGAPLYKLMAFAEEAWEYFEKKCAEQKSLETRGCPGG